MSLRAVDWDMGRLEELIEARGEDVIVETAVACTCRGGGTDVSLIEREGTPASYRRFNCRKCQGDGWIYRNARIVLGLVTGVNPGRDKHLIEGGYATPGDSVMSPSLNTHPTLTDFDKVTFLFAEPVNEGEVKMRGAAHLEDNVHTDTDLTVDEDRLWYIATCSIWCEDEDGLVYVQDGDYVLEDRKIRWIGSQPAVGKLYTIKYMGYPEWIVYSQPFQRFDRNRNLGPRVILKKKHVAFQSGSHADTPATRQEEQQTFTSKVKI